MAAKAKTLTIAVAASASYTLPTESSYTYALKNIGSNNIWLLHAASGTASQDGDECEVILPSEVVYCQGYDSVSGKIIIARAVTGDTKLNVAASMGRW